MSARIKSDQTGTKVFLVDDHPLVREWLSQLIQRENDMTVCGEAEDTQDALEVRLQDERDPLGLNARFRMGPSGKLVVSRLRVAGASTAPPKPCAARATISQAPS